MSDSLILLLVDPNDVIVSFQKFHTIGQLCQSFCIFDEGSCLCVNAVSTLFGCCRMRDILVGVFLNKFQIHEV